MTNYKIITDEKLLNDFIDWLPDLEINERFYVCLFARKKYCSDVKYIKTDKSQCKRFLSTKKDLFNKIRKLEVKLGSYVIKDIEIPQEALSLYISINPRDLYKATFNSLIKLAQLLKLEYNGWNPVAETMSEVHKTASRKIYYDLDFDDIEYAQIRKQAEASLNKDALTVLKTRGGFHLLIELKAINKEFSKTWYKNITAIEGCDIRGDNLIPVPGTFQGGFTPHFI